MNGGQGFVDLRLNHQDAESDEGFWPSFTDIMTVIVMIFLLAMVILLVRNIELVNQLRATMEAERNAAELARATGEEKESLALKLINTENELSMLRMRLMHMEETREEQEAAISSQRSQIDNVSKERNKLSLQVTQLQDDSRRLTQELVATRRNLRDLRNDYRALEEKQQLSLRDLDALRLLAQAKDQELETTRSRLQEADQALENVEIRYSDLKVKYDKLVRPARTPKGKFVVEVRYSKQADIYKVEYKDGASSEFIVMSEKELDARLTQLKQQHANKLYIKVIFPEESGLSYNEAWSFTSKLHKHYDYYYQEPAEDAN